MKNQVKAFEIYKWILYNINGYTKEDIDNCINDISSYDYQGIYEIINDNKTYLEAQGI